MLLLLLTLLPVGGGAQEIFVSTDGNDANDGTLKHPLRNIQTALDRGARTVTLRQGTYVLDAPVVIRPQNSGTADRPFVLQSYPSEEAIISGGTTDAFSMVSEPDTLGRILGIDTARRCFLVPTPEVMEGENAMMIIQQWATALLRIRKLEPLGDTTRVYFREPESTLEFTHPYPQPVIGGPRGNSAFAFVTLRDTGNRPELLRIEGDSRNPVEYVIVQNITFMNTGWQRPLTQGHVPLQAGLPLTRAYLMNHPGTPWSETLNNQAWVVRPEAAVSVSHAREICLSGCAFTQIACTALDIRQGACYVVAEGNLFQEIGGTAIMAGSFQESPVETHVPYVLDGDTTDYCHHLTIRGNRIYDTGILDHGTAGITCGYVAETHVDSNNVVGVGWSGICMGWGWTPRRTMMHDNAITNNRIANYGTWHHDCGGIYTLSWQPGSVISGNSVADPPPAPYATNDRVFPLYLDDSSNGFIITGNSFRAQDCGTNNNGDDIKFSEE